jgi:hypothetical protein
MFLDFLGKNSIFFGFFWQKVGSCYHGRFLPSSAKKPADAHASGYATELSSVNISNEICFLRNYKGFINTLNKMSQKNIITRKKYRLLKTQKC